MNYEFISFFAAAFELTGIFLLGKKNKLGWLICIGGGISWICYSLLTHSAFGLLVVCSAALFINIKGYKNWTQKK
jgi:hypothetical protein